MRLWRTTNQLDGLLSALNKYCIIAKRIRLIFCQGRGFRSALQTEKEIRNNYLAGSDTIYSLEDLKLGAKGDLMELSPGRRVQLTLGGDGGSLFRYRAVVLDAQPESPNFSYHCAVFLVPKVSLYFTYYSSLSNSRPSHFQIVVQGLVS